MKRKLTPEAREAMSNGGRKGSTEAKRKAGRKGYKALVAKIMEAKNK